MNLEGPTVERMLMEALYSWDKALAPCWLSLSWIIFLLYFIFHCAYVHIVTTNDSFAFPFAYKFLPVLACNFKYVMHMRRAECVPKSFLEVRWQLAGVECLFLLWGSQVRNSLHHLPRTFTSLFKIPRVWAGEMAQSWKAKLTTKKCKIPSRSWHKAHVFLIFMK